jgi:hypothetical protein
MYPSLADALKELSEPARAAYDAGAGSVVP